MPCHSLAYSPPGWWWGSGVGGNAWLHPERLQAFWGQIPFQPPTSPHISFLTKTLLCLLLPSDINPLKSSPKGNPSIYPYNHPGQGCHMFAVFLNPVTRRTSLGERILHPGSQEGTHAPIFRPVPPSPPVRVALQVPPQCQPKLAVSALLQPARSICFAGSSSPSTTRRLLTSFLSSPFLEPSLCEAHATGPAL